MTLPHRLVLASGSPRRSQLLESAGFAPEIRPADVDETPLPNEDPGAYVVRLSAAKARAVARPQEIVVGADTSVVLDGQILGKPADRTDAAKMLRSLSGRRHEVITGVSIVLDDREASHLEKTTVEMVDLSSSMIEWYVATGEPMDKAGSYAIQGRAACFVNSVAGSVTNVIGLPLAQLMTLLASFGLEASSLRSSP